MAHKSVPELQEAFEGLKFGFCLPTKPFLEIKHTNFFLSIQNTLQFFFSETKIFYYKQNYSALSHAKNFVEINNNKLRVLNDI